jgi:hypothetical protein
VRIGNGAFDQRQNDVYGAVLDSILLDTRRSQRLPGRLWPIVVSQAEFATRVWPEPDQGIWEARGEELVQHLSRTAHERVQQGKLLGRQVDLLVVAPDLARGRIQPQVADLEHSRALDRAPARERPQPGQ